MKQQQFQSYKASPMYTSQQSGIVRIVAIVLCLSLILTTSCATPAANIRPIDLHQISQERPYKTDILHVHLLNGQHWMLRDYMSNDTTRILSGQCNFHGNEPQYAAQWEGYVNVHYSDIQSLQKQRVDTNAELMTAALGFAVGVGIMFWLGFGSMGKIPFDFKGIR